MNTEPHPSLLNLWHWSKSSSIYQTKILYFGGGVTSSPSFSSTLMCLARSLKYFHSYILTNLCNTSFLSNRRLLKRQVRIHKLAIKHIIHFYHCVCLVYMTMLCKTSCSFILWTWNIVRNTFRKAGLSWYPIGYIARTFRPIITASEPYVFPTDSQLLFWKVSSSQWFWCWFAWSQCFCATCTDTKDPTSPTRPRAPNTQRPPTPHLRETPPFRRPPTKARRNISSEVGCNSLTFKFKFN